MHAIGASDAVIDAISAGGTQRLGVDDEPAVSWRGSGDVLRRVVEQTGGRVLRPVRT